MMSRTALKHTSRQHCCMCRCLVRPQRCPPDHHHHLNACCNVCHTVSGPFKKKKNPYFLNPSSLRRPSSLKPVSLFYLLFLSTIAVPFGFDFSVARPSIRSLWGIGEGGGLVWVWVWSEPRCGNWITTFFCITRLLMPVMINTASGWRTVVAVAVVQCSAPIGCSGFPPPVPLAPLSALSLPTRTQTKAPRTFRNVWNWASGAR